MDPLTLSAKLSPLLAEPAQVSVGDSERDLHAEDSSLFAPHRPDAVVFARSSSEVAAVVAFAAAEHIPVTPYGAGTSNGGKTIPVRGGISLDLSRMAEIRLLDTENRLAVVQPGVLRETLNQRAGPVGLSFPIDPGANASLGGMAATNASGTTTVRYGSMRHHVRALEVVLADGSLARTGTRAAKSSAGYDMTGLFVGSEGTLAVITELTLVLQPIPEAVIAVRVTFSSVDLAVRSAVAIIGAGTLPIRLELLDGPTIAIVSEHFGMAWPPGPTLFIELGGSVASASSDLETVVALVADAGGRHVAVERDPTARQALWRARHGVGAAMAARYPGHNVRGTDVCVPVSELPAALRRARDLAAEFRLEAAVIAHAGDGNYHLVVPVALGQPEAVARFGGLHRALVGDALARAGTSTAEHGIGLMTGFLEAEHGDLLSAQRAVKQALDPAGILNPGKIIAPS
jgi:D-lactate dehydrogenase (cytochrome)